MSPKPKCYQNRNVTKSNKVLKIKIKLQDIGPDISNIFDNLKPPQMNLLIYLKD